MIARINKMLRTVGGVCLFTAAFLALDLASSFSWHLFVTALILLSFWVVTLFLPKP